MNITPPCLRALYDIPYPKGGLAEGILGIYEDTGDVYSQADLNAYFAEYAPYVPQDTHPSLVSINGAVAPFTNISMVTGESDVDLDIAFALLGDVPITLYQAQPPATLPDNFTGNVLTSDLLDAFDASFCSEEDKAAGFQCGGATLPTVLSVSYGGPELQSLSVQQRACNEFMKLGLQGHTFVFASGDYGVSTNVESIPHGCEVNGCIARDFSAFNGSLFNPQFPATCPYVLAVGATQLNSNDTVRDPESSMFQPDLGVQQGANCSHPTTFFSSTGGFSNYFPQPSYQKSAVSTYFAEHDPGYASYDIVGAEFYNATSIPTGIYNRAGRGYPDVSANGANLNIIIQGIVTQSAGTSLAAPIWASLLALINQARQSAGKRSVGFVNPVLYENPQIFHDITNGTNPGCGTDGFSAVEGWDPVTGLGTPDYPTLEKLLLSLP